MIIKSKVVKRYIKCKVIDEIGCLVRVRRGKIRRQTDRHTYLSEIYT